MCILNIKETNLVASSLWFYVALLIIGSATSCAHVIAALAKTDIDKIL